MSPELGDEMAYWRGCQQTAAMIYRFVLDRRTSHDSIELIGRIEDAIGDVREAIGRGEIPIWGTNLHQILGQVGAQLKSEQKG
jgi:hypothetical protein